MARPRRPRRRRCIDIASAIVVRLFLVFGRGFDLLGALLSEIGNPLQTISQVSNWRVRSTRP